MCCKMLVTRLFVFCTAGKCSSASHCCLYEFLSRSLLICGRTDGRADGEHSSLRRNAEANAHANLWVELRTCSGPDFSRALYTSAIWHHAVGGGCILRTFSRATTLNDGRQSAVHTRVLDVRQWPPSALFAFLYIDWCSNAQNV